jgi:hypothetical protein
MPGCKLRRPYLVVGARRIAVLPNIADIQRMRDQPRSDLIAEQAVQYVLVDRQRALREHRISQLLELLHDLVVQSWIVVIHPT